MPVQLLPVPMNRPQVTASGRGLPFRANRTIEPLDRERPPGDPARPRPTRRGPAADGAHPAPGSS
ncbi:hypothetical protein LV779_18240 [Streptomyces thinghirensis]|nr:hypothetical protein [Streptomyces thinghirensis]